MSDLITDAMVEAARQADYLHDPQRMECLNHDGSCCPAFDHNVGDERTHRVRAALEAVAPLIAAKALRQDHEGIRSMTDQELSAQKLAELREAATGWPVLAALVAERDRLAAAIERIEHDARCPHPKCPGHGMCCCPEAKP
jgi:hypothetical protein